MASRGERELSVRVLVFAMLGLLLAGCGQRGLERLAPGETGRVTEVSSGDSFVLDNGLQVRLAGVEAPWRDAPFAVQARTALAELILDKKVQLLYGGARRNGCVALLSLFLGRSWRDISMSSTPITIRSVIASTMPRFASNPI